MNDKNELKPCPWCNETPEIEDLSGRIVKQTGFELSHYCDVAESRIEFGRDWLRDNLVERWNTRAEVSDE